MTLGYVILGLVALAFFHFIFEGIVAPSRQMVHRLELLRTAREVECLKEDKTCGLQPEAGELLRRRIYNVAHGMPHFNVVLIVKTMIRLQQDPEFRQRSEANQQILEAMPECAKVIHRRVRELANTTLSINTMGWAGWVIPVVAAVAMYKQTEKAVRALLSMTVGQMEQIDHVPSSTNWASV